MDLGLAGARALVGGGSGGLGSAIAATLRAEGASVGLVARPSDRLTEQAARLDALAIPADLSTADGPAAAIEAGVAAFGGLDLLVVNSGGPPPGRFDELDEAAWQTAIDGTLWSSVRLLRAALPHLRAGRDPAILVILSSSAREPIPGSDDLEPAQAGAGRASSSRWSRRSPRSASTASRRAGSPPPGSPRSTRLGRGRPGSRSRRSSARRSPGSRSAGTATRSSSAGSRPSCCRPRRRTSPGRSCRSTAG